MPKIFVARAPVKESESDGHYRASPFLSLHPLTLLIIPVGFLSSVHYQTSASSGSPFGLSNDSLELSAMTFCGLLALIAVLILMLLTPRGWPTPQQKQAVVTIYPLGVQLSSTQTKGKKRFIFREQIIDCVVNEVILVHKVINVVILRLCFRDGTIKLVDAFPGVELSYKDCLIMRSQINEALAYAADTS
jgi:hypothetical protein